MTDMLICKDVLSNSDVKFGTSGARGLVEDFTPEVCAAFVSAFLTRISKCFASDTLFLGIDNRPSSPIIAKLCASAAIAVGYKVRYFGVLPTPALALYALANKQPSIMVTGSHIPFDRNGLKFYTPEGEITKQDEQEIVTSTENVVLSNSPFLLNLDCAAIEAYKARYCTLFGRDTLRNKRIGVYEHSSAGRDIFRGILESLGADVISFGRSDEFVPIDTEAVSDEDKERAKAWVNEFKLDAIFSTDGDGDRPLIADEHGNWLRGDIVGLLTCMELGIESVATPVSCNSAIESSGEFKEVSRTRIGSPYVIAEFPTLATKYNTTAGFEANGGFMLGSTCQYNGADVAPLPTRDAMLPFIMIMARSVNKSCTVSALSESLPSRFTDSDRLKNMPTEKSKDFIAHGVANTSLLVKKLGLANHIVALNQVDGLRMTLSNDDIVHLRPSGNAPEMRVYVESGGQDSAKQLLDLVLSKLQKILVS
ncbi:MAG: phosphomannomutase [Alteromonadaceae bacterium]|nr:phosphomannomutase [Alteromonadaceae bacterium]